MRGQNQTSGRGRGGLTTKSHIPAEREGQHQVSIKAVDSR